MKHRILAVYSAAALFSITTIVLLAQQHLPANAYNPGIHPVTPESVEAEKIAEDAWFAHLQVLASDDLKGRKTGTDDFIRAVEYVESQYKAIGLKPAGVDGYRQPVGFHSATVDAEHSSLELVQADQQVKALKIETEATLIPNDAGAVSVDAPAVFAGYGLVVPSLGVDDLKGLDVKGKVAVIFGASPAAVHGDSRHTFAPPRSVGSRSKPPEQLASSLFPSQDRSLLAVLSEQAVPASRTIPSPSSPTPRSIRCRGHV